MTDTLAALLIPQAYQDSDGLISESLNVPATGPYTFRLGSTLNPPYPSGVPLIPAGAAPLGPAPAPTAGAGLTTGALTNNGVYKWALSLVTKYGETVPSNLLTVSGIGSGNTGQTINLPAGTTGTGTNPVVSRRLWRTKTGGSQLYLAAEFDDANVSVYVDEVSDTELVTTAPTSDTSGLEGAVSISGTNSASTTTWTEIPEGTAPSAAGQFSVSYDVGNAGGVLTFYSGDQGLPVTVQYAAGTLVGSAYYNLIKTALSVLHAFGIVQLSPSVAQAGSIDVTGGGTFGGVVKSGAVLPASGGTAGAQNGAGSPYFGAAYPGTGGEVYLKAGSTDQCGTIYVKTGSGGVSNGNVLLQVLFGTLTTQVPKAVLLSPVWDSTGSGTPSGIVGLYDILLGGGAFSAGDGVLTQKGTGFFTLAVNANLPVSTNGYAVDYYCVF